MGMFKNREPKVLIFSHLAKQLFFYWISPTNIETSDSAELSAMTSRRSLCEKLKKGVFRWKEMCALAQPQRLFEDAYWFACEVRNVKLNTRRIFVSGSGFRIAPKCLFLTLYCPDTVLTPRLKLSKTKIYVFPTKKCSHILHNKKPTLLRTSKEFSGFTRLG